MSEEVLSLIRESVAAGLGFPEGVLVAGVSRWSWVYQFLRRPAYT